MAITTCICFCLIAVGICVVEVARLLSMNVKRSKAAFEYALKNAAKQTYESNKAKK